MVESANTLHDETPPSRAQKKAENVLLRRLSGDVVFLGAALVIGVIVAIAIFAPVIAPMNPLETSMTSRLSPIRAPGHLLGTDELGRDMLSRLIHGARPSLLMALVPVTFAFLIGGTLGLVAGYFGGATGTIIMRSIDVLFAFPSVLLAVAISGALGASMTNVILSLTIIFVPPICRIAESRTSEVARMEFVDAARISGASDWAIMRHQIVGNIIGPVFVYASSLVSVSIILASGLSFLGLGVRPPTPEWGVMLNTLRGAIYVQPWVAALPGALIFVTSMGFNLMADSIRTAMDIR